MPPIDHYRTCGPRWCCKLIRPASTVEVHHHEVGTRARRRSTCGSARCSRWPTTCMLYKYIVKNVAWQAGKTVTFMPKPLFGDNGSGMHCHQSLWKDGEPCSTTRTATPVCRTSARYYIGGLLKHAPSLLAFTNPTTNSYRRLVPGYEAPINLVYSQRNRSACVRIPIYRQQPEGASGSSSAAPDPSCNPYLAFSAMLMAGLDGIRNKIEPPDAGGQGPLRAAAGRGRRTSRRSPARWRRRWTAWRPTTSS